MPRDSSRIEEILRQRSLPDVARLLENRRPIIIYGAGNIGKQTADILLSRGNRVLCFFDKAAREGDMFDNIPIVRPHSPGAEPAYKDALVIIAVFNRDADVRDIERDLRRAGYENILLFTHFYQFFHQQVGQRFWLAPLDFYNGLHGVLKACHALWCDEASKRNFLALLEYRMTGLFNVDVSTQEQYFPDDVPLRNPSRFIDCGAFDGDTIRQLHRKQGPIRSILAFEPDGQNFSKLAAMIQSHGTQYAEEILLWPCGVWSSTCQTGFSCGNGESSSANPNSAAQIQCVALDDIMTGIHPDFIKLDIEGAEGEALMGAKRVILADRPDLAVCVYHRPADLWQLPLLLYGWKAGYEFYLRVHGQNGFDAVLYAVAKA